MKFSYNVYKNEINIDNVIDQGIFERSVKYAIPVGFLGKILKILGFAKEITLTNGTNTTPIWVDKKKFNKFLTIQGKSIPTHLEEVIAEGIKNIKEEMGEEEFKALREEKLRGILEPLKEQLERYKPQFEAYAKNNKNTVKQLMKITITAWLNFKEGESKLVRLDWGLSKVLVTRKGEEIELSKHIKTIERGTYGEVKVYKTISQNKEWDMQKKIYGGETKIRGIQDKSTTVTS